MTQEALKLLLEVKEELKVVMKQVRELIAENKALKEALAREKALQALHNENERLGLYKDAYAEQEPVAWATKEDFHRELERRIKHIHEEMKIKSVTMRCKDYDIALPIIDTDFGRVLVGQVSTPPQRKPLTDDEIKKMRHLIDWTAGWSYNTFARAIEAAHGIKENT